VVRKWFTGRLAGAAEREGVRRSYKERGGLVSAPSRFRAW